MMNTPRPEAFGLEYLRQQARWIRDDLDPQIALDGQDTLHSDEILTLDELLRRLLEADLSLEEIRVSRMHLAVNVIAGMATRWPTKLIERCDAINDRWEAKYGVLKMLGTPLYEPGGRLHGICKPEDVNNEKLLIKWLKSPGAKLSPAVARKSGDLGFKPGDWWISPLFAHRAGIIDSPNSEGGITSDADGAYAIVLIDRDEVDSTTPERFRYHARNRDSGRYRLTAATPESRHPIRILRSHSLHSFWRPRAGLRYDGLYKVTGWTWKKDAKNDGTVCIIDFERFPNQVSMQTVLLRPWTDEIEDYMEYKRLRDLHRHKQPVLNAPNPKLKVSIDGSIDVHEDETSQSPFEEQFTDCSPIEEEDQRASRASEETSKNGKIMYVFGRASGLH